MARGLTLGRYFPAASVIHRLDPRTKVISALAVMLSVFFVRTSSQLVFAWLLALAAVAASRVPPAHVLRSLAPVVAVTALVGILNLLLVRGGVPILSVGPLTITSDGAWAALLYPLRLAVAVTVTAVLLLTTTPTQLTDALDAFLSPLARLGLPAHELAMVFALMLRFIPTLMGEATAIVDAQASRGAILNEGGPLRRLRAVASIVVALLASALRHASDLSRALDARCYVGGATRTHWHPLHMRVADWCALAITAASVALLLRLGIG